MVSRPNNHKVLWPNFFIVGASRSGTTSLYKYLKAIPSVYMSPVKEPGYFAQPRIPERAEYLKLFDGGIHDKCEYLKLFEGVKDEVAVGEASTNYLWRPEAASRIHDTVPDARIIISLMTLTCAEETHYHNFLPDQSLQHSIHKQPPHRGRTSRIGRATNSPTSIGILCCLIPTRSTTNYRFSINNAFLS